MYCRLTFISSLVSHVFSTLLLDIYLCSKLFLYKQRSSQLSKCYNQPISREASLEYVRLGVCPIGVREVLTVCEVLLCLLCQQCRTTGGTKLKPSGMAIGHTSLSAIDNQDTAFHFKRCQAFLPFVCIASNFINYVI